MTRRAPDAICFPLSRLSRPVMSLGQEVRAISISKLEFIELGATSYLLFKQPHPTPLPLKTSPSKGAVPLCNALSRRVSKLAILFARKNGRQSRRSKPVASPSIVEPQVWIGKKIEREREREREKRLYFAMRDCNGNSGDRPVNFIGDPNGFRGTM